MTILVGYRPNEYGEVALLAGIEHAKLRGEDLMVVNASRTDDADDADRLSAEAKAEMEKRLEDLGVTARVHRTHGEDVSAEILRIALDEAASLLIIGIRQRSAVGKLVLGSTAHRLIMDAQCPVLTVKPGH